MTVREVQVKTLDIDCVLRKMNDYFVLCGYGGGMMWRTTFNFGRKILILLTLLLCVTAPVHAQDEIEEETGFVTSILQRLGIGGEALPEGEEPEPIINPLFVPPILAGVALGVAGILIFLGYQAPAPKRDPFNRRL